MIPSVQYIRVVYLDDIPFNYKVTTYKDTKNDDELVCNL